MSADNIEVPAELVTALRNAKSQAAKWAEIANTARTQLETIIGDAETGTIDGVTVIRWPHIKTTKLSQAIVKEHYPHVFALCKETTVSRRFTLIDP